MEKIEEKNELYQTIDSDFFYIIKMILYSSIGMIIFFVPIKIDGETKTILYHLAYNLQINFRPLLEACTVIFITIGCVKDILKTNSNKNNQKKIFIYLRLFSILLTINIFYGNNRGILINQDVSFFMEEMILNLVTVLPISAIFITFVMDYGLLDIVESYFHKFMKKAFNLSGKTVLNILYYIFTDCFCGYFMTEKLYKTGKIRQNEACMLILNFSIMSLPMISYISEELNLKKINLVVVSMILLIISNSILAKLYPINQKKKSYYIKTSYKETYHKNDKFKKAISKHLKNKNEENIFKSIINNLEEAMYIIVRIVPSAIISLYLGYLIVNNEIIIDILNQVLYPFTEMLKIENVNQLNRFIVNLFYNNIVAIDVVYKKADYITKFVIGIIAILNCTSISSNIIYILNSKIPIRKKEFIISYILRLLVIILIYFAVYYFYIGYIK